MKSQSISVPASGVGRHSAAFAMASRFDAVFRSAFESDSLAGRAKAVKVVVAGKRNLFVMLGREQDAPVLNRDAAAHWASQSIPAAAVNLWMKASGLERKKDVLAALLVSPSTLSRAKPDATLDAGVTERMLRQSELFVRAAEVFGDDGATWMTKPHDLLDGKSPLEYATNEFGGAKVRQILNAIEYGGVV